MSDESHALAIPTPGGTLLPEWWTKIYGPVCMYRTTLDTTKPEQRAQLLSAVNDDVPGCKSVLNVPIEIVGYTASPAGRVVEGEIQEWVRIVLHLADGSNIASGSMGLLKSLMLIEQLDRPAPWRPPIVKVLRARDLADGKQWFWLADPPSKKGTK